MRWSWFTDQFFNERKQREERAFYENGSLLLKKLIASCNAKPIPVRTFSPQQLLLATNNYSSELLGVDWGYWYKGSVEGRTVLVKRSDYDSDDLDSNDFVIDAEMSAEITKSLMAKSLQRLIQAANNLSFGYRRVTFAEWYQGSLEGRIVLIKRLYGADLAINDLVISAQMSGHSNVLKPIGCCLHTPSPIFVFEYAANGFLADRIYVSRVTERQHQPMVWERRLKIARQIAHALSYLHTAFPRPVIHLSIKMSSILLDEHDVPKLSDFLFSVSIPEGEAEVDAPMISSFRSPEFNATGKVTEKADVFDFGRILLELLTGENSYKITRLTIDKDSTLVAYIHNLAQGSCINEIVDPAILAEDGEGGATLLRQLQAVLDLALTCTNKDPQRRPTMVDVTKQLRRIERFAQTGEVLLGNLQNSKLHESFEDMLLHH